MVVPGLRLGNFWDNSGIKWMKQDANSGKCSILFILANISVKQMKQDANSSKWSILCMLQNSGVRQMKQDINSDRWSSSYTSVDSTTYNFIKGILTSWASQKEFFCFFCWQECLEHPQKAHLLSTNLV